MPENPSPKPVVYLLHGNDEFAIEQFTSKLVNKLGDRSHAELNLQRFASENFNFSAFSESCRSLPFLSGRRMIIVEDALKLVEAKSRMVQLAELLEDMPQTTALVLIARRDLEPNLKKRKPVHPLLEWARNNPQIAFIRRFAKPQGRSFIQWIQGRCRELGGSIELQSAHLLAELVAEDPLLADQELAKLLDYVDRKRAIQVRDVERLTPLLSQTDIFALVDAVGQRKGRLALLHLHRLLDKEEPRYIFAMILRQFRMLLRAREALDQGTSPRQVLGTHPFVADKVAHQARNFSLAHLELIYHQLLSIDLASKNGKAKLEIELDRMVASLAR